jgi:hypothetical protein
MTDEDKIIRPFIGESIETSKRRKEKIDAIIYSVSVLTEAVHDLKRLPNIESGLSLISQALRKFKEEEL